MICTGVRHRIVDTGSGVSGYPELYFWFETQIRTQLFLALKKAGISLPFCTTKANYLAAGASAAGAAASFLAAAFFLA